MTACGTCERIRQRDAGSAPFWDSIARLGGWDVVHAYDSTLPGWIVLVLQRHIESVDELTDPEAHALGALLRKVSAFLRKHVGCTKTYVMQFAEHPKHPHVHFHVVPRMPDIPEENIGGGVFNYLGADEAHRVPEDEMNELGRRLRRALID